MGENGAPQCETCRTCIYWHPEAQEVMGQLGSGVCFRYPPVPYVASAQGRMATINVRPVTDGGAIACGEHRMKVTIDA